MIDQGSWRRRILSAALAMSSPFCGAAAITSAGRQYHGSHDSHRRAIAAVTQRRTAADSVNDRDE